MSERMEKAGTSKGQVGGLAGWLLERLRTGRRAQPRLALLERISLAPRQSLALVEAEGRRFLVATSPEGGPVFYALDETPGVARAGRGNASLPIPVANSRVAARAAQSSARVSW